MLPAAKIQCTALQQTLCARDITFSNISLRDANPDSIFGHAGPL
jgi:hypothetical protein